MTPDPTQDHTADVADTLAASEAAGGHTPADADETPITDTRFDIRAESPAAKAEKLTPPPSKPGLRWVGRF